MKSILDRSFRYRPSFATDVRRTFERIRREQEAQAHAAAKSNEASREKVLQLGRAKKAG
jgi:hypothetical protein